MVHETGRALVCPSVALQAVGIRLDIVPGTGPHGGQTGAQRLDVAALPALEPETVEAVATAVRLLVAELGPDPVDRFRWGPVHPRFLTLSRAARAVSQRDYRHFVVPHSARVLAGLADTGVPRIHFGVGTGELLRAMAQAGADVVGVD